MCIRDRFMADHFQNQIKFWGMAPSFAFVSEPETNGVGGTLLPNLQGAGRLWPHLQDYRRRSSRRAGVLQALQCRVAHREKWTMQSAPNPHRLGASQHEASRLTQTCVQRTGCGTESPDRYCY